MSLNNKRDTKLVKLKFRCRTSVTQTAPMTPSDPISPLVLMHNGPVRFNEPVGFYDYECVRRDQLARQIQGEGASCSMIPLDPLWVTELVRSNEPFRSYDYKYKPVSCDEP